MHKIQELKILSSLIKQKDMKPASKTKRLAINLISWLVVGLIASLSYNYFGRPEIPDLVIFFGALAMGVFIGVISMCDVSRNQWPAIKPHINFKSIEERVRELET
ncbi:hypothetical protein [Pseudomonas mangrovi]|nr:hypothetical protein [Pseudomonas mangrovi]